MLFENPILRSLEFVAVGMFVVFALARVIFPRAKYIRRRGRNREEFDEPPPPIDS
jgi:hypothetical protein